MSTAGCNADVFLYNGQQSILYIIIGLNVALCIFLLYKMCLLCSQAFSYSNFHIHATYKFYALTVLSVSLMILSRKTQLDYINIEEAISKQTAVESQRDGLKILNQVVGIISIYASNMMYALNGFTWLTICLGCDFVQNRDSAMSDSSTATGQNLFRTRTRKRLRALKFISMYIMFPVLVILSFIGTLKQQNGWCSTASYSIIISTIFALLLFMVAAGTFLYKRFYDPSVLKRTKATLIYLVISMLVRQIYFIINQFSESSQFLNEYLTLLYVITCTLLPIIGMSFLSNIQLQKQKCALLKSSQILLFKSTIG